MPIANIDRLQAIVHEAVPGSRLLSVGSAFGAFTNDVIVVECKERTGRAFKLVIKSFVDEPEFASKCAQASFRALEMSKTLSVPVPQPILKDETGELLGAPGLITGSRLLSVGSAFGAFTNDVIVVECKERTGRAFKLVIKSFVDEPEFASKCAQASFRALEMSKTLGVPVPQPILKDETGELLGAPGLITSFVEGRQIASPKDTSAWAQELAELLLLIHNVRPPIVDKGLLFEGQEEALFILRDYAARERLGHPLSNDIYGAVGDLLSHLKPAPAVLLHMDYWQGNVLWHGDHISAVVDWDFASYGDPAIDVAYFRMNMYLRGIKPAADIFLRRYEEVSGRALKNLGFWEVVAAARPLPNPALWIPASREMGDLTATDDRAKSDYYEFVADAIQRAYGGL